MIKRRLRTLLIARLLGGDAHRWALYFGGLAVLRTLRKYVRGEPELLYTATLSPGQRLGVLTQKPAPAAVQTRRRRRALAARLRAELGS